MKQLLFALLLLPFYCHAQLEVGVNGGLAPYHVGRERINTTLKDGHGYDLSLSYKVHAVRLGLGYNAATLPLVQRYSNGGLMPIGQANLYYAKPLSSAYLFADHEARFDHLYFDLGVSVGAAFLRNGSYLEYAPASASGIAVGVHAGCSYDFFKGLCANVQAGITDAILNANTIAGSFTVTTFPLTVGLHYKLHLHKPRPPAAGK